MTLANVLAGRKVTYWNSKGILTLNLLLLLPQISSYATGFDGSMMNGLQALDTWANYFGNPEGSALAIFNCIQSVGQIASVPLMAFGADRYGRKFGMAVGAVIILIGVILQAAAQNVGMFIAARGVIGFGLGISITAAPVLILELAYPTQRGAMTSLYNSLWSLGSVSASWITYGTFFLGNTWAWRIPSLLQGLASVIQLFFMWFLPESPRWLVENDQEDKAAAIITKYHANGDKNDEIVPLEIAEIKTAIAIEKEMNKSASYAAMFRGRGNQMRSMIIVAVGFFSQWSGNGLISYYLTVILNSIGYTDPQQQLMINGVLNAYNLVTSVAASSVCDRFRRRSMFLFSTAGMFLSFLCWTIAESIYEKSAADTPDTPNVAAGRTVLGLIFIYNGFFNAGWTPLQVTYVIEITPLALRAKALTIYNLTVSAALIFNQYANPVALEAIGWKYYIVYTVWLAVELAFVYFFFRETQGLSLEEAAAVYDGSQVVDSVAESANVEQLHHDMEGSEGLSSKEKAEEVHTESQYRL